jgi:hypothetical protein
MLARVSRQLDTKISMIAIAVGGGFVVGAHAAILARPGCLLLGQNMKDQ